ncbi:major facilitator superfamily domain-containing protein [Xylogone sp. PMI_703]|nr:major facilitator superfamily domain-containing protein [Xylogone sp. PMI_703]
MTATLLAAFLVTLDQNVISTAIPRITDEFHSLNDIGWYGSAYLLTACSFQLLMGKIYKFYPTKPIFLICCALFELGSAVCGAAPSSNAFIVGRAIAGLGCSGILSGAMVILFHTIPLQQRPIYQGSYGAVFAIGSVIGPLIGGLFTDKVTWRWCFYINLPIGAVSMIVTIFVLHLPNQTLDAQASGWRAKLLQLDPIGNLAFFPGVVCLILGLQWGGTKYPWNDGRVIVLLILSGVFAFIFVGIQTWKQESASVPPRIIKQQSVAAVTWFSFFNGGGSVVFIYYLPLWFQAVKDVSAVKSGLMLLPMILSSVFCALCAGIAISKFGYYNPFLLLSSVLMPIGAGLLTTLTPTTGHSKWIGYQVLFGIGSGIGVQQPLTVVQTVLEKSDIATGSALILFTRFLGSAIFLPVAENIFLNSLVSKLTNLPNISPTTVTESGATQLKNLASGTDLETLISDYNSAIINEFYMVIATCSITIFGALFVEWRSVKSRAGERTI